MHARLWRRCALTRRQLRVQNRRIAAVARARFRAMTGRGRRVC
jgi:hypothetical protein